ncbi:MAG: complement resistance protein TraT [Candidatus Pacebacteria bacterium]|nr:complement resistance protein TraT [Candidatus Paceibacterota bacterium]
MTRHTAKNSLMSFALASAIILVQGCSTMDSMYRGTTRVVDPDKMTLQTDLRWLSPPISMGLRPPAANERAVYFRLKNSAGVAVPGLYEEVVRGLQQAGYRVTQDPSEAHFNLVSDVRYFGETRTKDGLGPLLTGAVLGGATGAVIGHNVGDGYGREGAVAGAVVGGAIGNVMANRNKMVEIALVVDLRIGERIQGGVNTLRKGSTEAGVTHRDVVGVGGEEGGHSATTTTTTQQVEVEDEFLYHGNRIATSGKKMGLTPAEALPVLTEKISLALSSVLP